MAPAQPKLIRVDSLLLELGQFFSQGLAGNASKCLTKKERLLGIKGILPWALPQPHEGQAGLSPSCHLQSLVFISCCGSWGVGGRLQSHELKASLEQHWLALGAGVSDGQESGREMGGSGRRQHKGMVSGKGPSIFRAVILGNFLFIQRLEMRLSICQLSIYYQRISRGPQTLFPHFLTAGAHWKTCKEELQGSSILKVHLTPLFWLTFGETEAQRERISFAQGHQALWHFILDLLAFRPPEQTEALCVHCLSVSENTAGHI